MLAFVFQNLAIRKRVDDDPGGAHQGVLELGDLDGQQELGLGLGVGGRGQARRCSPGGARRGEASGQRRHQLLRRPQEIGAGERFGGGVRLDAAMPDGGGRVSRPTASWGAAAICKRGPPPSSSLSRSLSARSTCTRTRAAPTALTPSNSAARGDTAMRRDRAAGPRSFTRTRICRPVSSAVTRAIAGSCSVGCAAVRVVPSADSPFAVRPERAGATTARPVAS